MKKRHRDHCLLESAVRSSMRVKVCVLAKKIKNTGEEHSYHSHVDDASFPVPDYHPIFKRVPTLGYHPEKVPAYFMLAIPQNRAPARFQMKNPTVG
jgi:hypothetical protein